MYRCYQAVPDVKYCECDAVQATVAIMSIVLCDIVFAVRGLLEFGVSVVGRGCQARSYLHVNILTTAKHYKPIILIYLLNFWFATLDRSRISEYHMQTITQLVALATFHFRDGFCNIIGLPAVLGHAT